MTNDLLRAKDRRVGRKKLFPLRITLPLPVSTVARIDSLLIDGEARLDVIRDAIERELQRRERENAKPGT